MTDRLLATADAVQNQHNRKTARHGDTYASYADLAQCETNGKDYTIQARAGTASLAIIAPHGGGIETGTATVADAVAGDRYSFYAFKGIKPSGNAVLHITSHRFDEPTGLRIVRASDVTVAFHGQHDRSNALVYIGGRNEALKRQIQKLLTRNEIRAEMTVRSGLQAVHPLNLCNRCRSGRGIQLEISRAMREQMFDHLSCRSRRKKTPLFHAFVQAVRSAIDEMDPVGIHCTRGNHLLGVAAQRPP